MTICWGPFCIVQRKKKVGIQRLKSLVNYKYLIMEVYDTFNEILYKFMLSENLHSGFYTFDLFI